MQCPRPRVRYRRVSRETGTQTDCLGSCDLVSDAVQLTDRPTDGTDVLAERADRRRTDILTQDRPTDRPTQTY